MRKLLQDLGLSEKEARVYVASLELGRATAEKLATHAKVNRTTAYALLSSLMKRGLIGMFEEGKRTYFAPESPELLRRLLTRQQDDINARERDLVSLLPDFVRLYEGAGERPIVRFFPGKEGVVAARDEVLTMHSKELHVLFSKEKMSRVFSEKELDRYTARRKKLGIYSKVIHTDEEYFNRAGGAPLCEYRYIPGIPISIDMRIFDDKTALFSLEGSVFAMVIESRQIASSMRTLFNFLWEHATHKKGGSK